MKSKTKIVLAAIAGAAVVTGDLIYFGVKKVRQAYNDVKYGASKMPVDVPEDAVWTEEEETEDTADRQD